MSRPSGRRSVVSALAIAVLAAACGDRTAPARAAAPPQALRVPVGGEAAAAVLRPQADIAQVALDLEGESLPSDELTAELASVTAPDDAKRWPVDAPPAAATGLVGRVVVPIYALAPGEYLLVLWRGDADQVARYRFSVAAGSAD